MELPDRSAFALGPICALMFNNVEIYKNRRGLEAYLAVLKNKGKWNDGTLYIGRGLFEKVVYDKDFSYISQKEQETLGGPRLHDMRVDFNINQCFYRGETKNYESTTRNSEDSTFYGGGLESVERKIKGSRFKLSIIFWEQDRDGMGA